MFLSNFGLNSSINKRNINLECLTCMVKRILLNDDLFRQIMVGDSAAEYGDREDQHKDRQIQDGDQAVSCQAPLSHGGTDQAVTRNVSASQERLVSDIDLNMATKKGNQIRAYP